MLHHQHQIHPIPRNQLRDGNNVNRMAHPQMSMRLPQPGMPGQQRPPHPHNPHLMMGMQPPQPNVPGVMVPMASAVMTSNPMQQQSMQPHGKHPGVERMQNQMTPVTATTAAVPVPVVPITTPAQTPISPSHSQPPQQQQGGVVIQATPSCDNKASSEDKHPNIIISNNLANTKEKTPMCLINELARFNKVTHQYRLTSETGPAHKKKFTVTLKLGDEEYTSEGPSIKKAQHSAAADALASTRYEHPPPKTQRVLRVRKVNITPTVELNALAMKRGEPTSYNFLEPIPPPYPPNFNFRGMSYQRYHYNKPMYGPSMFYVTLRVGEREFSGQGRTAQSARHDAATKALLEIRQLPLPEGVEINGQENGEPEKEPVVAAAAAAPHQEPGSDLKSPISLVHEMALKRSLSVSFEVVREKGPPHMRTFLTSCRVGDVVTEGEGNSKKTSKKRAAEQMLDELRKLPPVSPPALAPQRMKRKPAAVKKKTRNLVKQQDQKAKPEYTDDVNPISRLIQIQQAKKEREPEYTLIEERGVPRRREFVMEVTVGQQSATGSGPNKKLAKRAAAEALLQIMGYSTPTEGVPSAPTGKSKGHGDKGRKVTFMDEAVSDSKENVSTPSSGNMQPGGSGGRQLVPGLLLMTDAQGFPSKAGNTSNGSGSGGPTRQTAAVIAKELLSCGSSPTAEALVAAGHMQVNASAPSPAQHVPVVAAPPPPAAVPAAAAAVTTASQTPRPKDLLNYLSNLLKFTVQYTDFPKVNHSEFLSLVSLSTTPPQVFHGAGPTTDASHDQAARTALQVLSELGLDAVNSSADTQNNTEGHTTDGIHILGNSKSAVTTNGK